MINQEDKQDSKQGQDDFDEDDDQNDNNEGSGNNANGGGSNEKGSNYGRWTNKEHQRFLDGLKMYGKDWRKIEEHIGSRTGAQIRSHAQKYYLKLDKVKNKDKKPLGTNPKDQKKKIQMKGGLKVNNNSGNNSNTGVSGGVPDEDGNPSSASHISSKKPAENQFNQNLKNKKKKVKKSDGHDVNIFSGYQNNLYPHFGMNPGFIPSFDFNTTANPNLLFSLDPMLSLQALSNPLQQLRTPYDPLSAFSQLAPIQQLQTNPQQANPLLGAQQLSNTSNLLQEQLLKQLIYQNPQQQTNNQLQQFLAQQNGLNPLLAQTNNFSQGLDSLNLLNLTQFSQPNPLLAAQSTNFALNPLAATTANANLLTQNLQNNLLFNPTLANQAQIQQLLAQTTLQQPLQQTQKPEEPTNQPNTEPDTTQTNKTNPPESDNKPSDNTNQQPQQNTQSSPHPEKSPQLQPNAQPQAQQNQTEIA